MPCQSVESGGHEHGARSGDLEAHQTLPPPPRNGRRNTWHLAPARQTSTSTRDAHESRSHNTSFFTWQTGGRICSAAAHDSSICGIVFSETQSQWQLDDWQSRARVLFCSTAKVSLSTLPHFLSPMPATRGCGAERCVCHAGLVWCLLQGSFEPAPTRRGTPSSWRACRGVVSVSRPLPTVERLQHLPCLTAAEAWLPQQQCLHMQTSISTSLIRAARHDPYLTLSISLASDHKQRTQRTQRNAGRGDGGRRVN
jgi:hypothetical protein